MDEKVYPAHSLDELISGRRYHYLHLAQLMTRYSLYDIPIDPKVTHFYKCDQTNKTYVMELHKGFVYLRAVLPEDKKLK